MYGNAINSRMFNLNKDGTFVLKHSNGNELKGKWEHVLDKDKQDNVVSAVVIFYNEFGAEIKKTEITEKGFGKIEANTENLASGIYTYSLIVDGKITDTPKMLRSR